MDSRGVRGGLLGLGGLAFLAIACPSSPPPPRPGPPQLTVVTPPPPAPAPSPAPAPNVVTAVATPLPAGVLTVDPGAGRNAFSAVFDAPLGERITAVSSAVECTVNFDDRATSFSGSCAVALPSIMVDSDSTKTDHFQQWVTNKKSEPKDCRFEARFEDVKLMSPLSTTTPAHFAADVPFTLCGRAREDGGREHVEGMVLLLPPNDDSPTPTLRIRAQIDGFSRSRYHVGPAWTDGWLARVQKYATVVADQGTIVLSLFAKGRE